MKSVKNSTNCLFIFLSCFLMWTGCEPSEDSISVNPSLDNNFTNSADGNFSGSQAGTPDFTGESYNEIIENPFIETADEPISTFSIDADGASYSNTRRFLSYNQLPPKDAIRTEELVNYFTFDYPAPSRHPISLDGEITECPWAAGHRLVRIGLKGKDIARNALPATNFVFLIDVSGSMKSEDKLELLKEGFIQFTDFMRDEDRIAIVTYAGSSGVLLESTAAKDRSKIKKAIGKLTGGGSTAGAEGIKTAYKIAEENFIQGGNNRVILGTDGDFNVGISDQESLVKLIEEKRETGIFLTVLGVGTGNLREGQMEQIANHGNGNFEYLDNVDQAKKVFIEEFNKFYTVAKDVKIQIQFDPTRIQKYRLIGYENRLLENEDFEDDTKDAGEIGSSQTITALYEIVPRNDSRNPGNSVSVDFRYKLPDSDVSHPINLNIKDEFNSFESASENTRFATAVAGFGLLLRDSEYKGELSYDQVIKWANDAKDFDPFNHRAEFLLMVNKAKEF